MIVALAHRYSAHVENVAIFQALGLGLALGFLVGMQRERTNSTLAGIRTFPLITILGVMSAVIADTFGAWIVVAAAAGVVAATVIGNLLAVRAGEAGDGGITTEIAILIMFSVGVLLALERTAVAVVIGGGVAILLHAKAPLRGFVARLGEKDLRAIMQFALITLVVLPILPNEPMGPFNVLNPRSIWLMVVLVVGISLAGYVLYRWLGARTGALLAGMVGGLVSSTATTVGLSRRAAAAPTSVNASVVGIMLAATVVYVRVLIEVYAVGYSVAMQIAWPIMLLGVTQAAIALVLWWRSRGEEMVVPEQENPADLRWALFFGAMFAAVLVAIAAARHYLGPGALFAVAALSGATDMDAITLSVAGMAEDGRVSASVAWRAIVIATIANMGFKCGIAFVLGGIALGTRVAVAFGIQSLIALLLVVLV